MVTNPDMLHSGVLPHHDKWHRLFENLKYVVVDELTAAQEPLARKAELGCPERAITVED